LDPRGAADLLEDPAGALDRLASVSGASFPHLSRARAYTASELAGRARELAGIDDAVVLFGSWGREELTAQSDDDWAVLSPSPSPSPEVLARCREVLGGSDREPGQQDLFGTAFSCDELVRNIGLDADTNTNLTRRMLLLLESRAVAGSDSYARCFAQVLHAYLGHGVRDYRPPRFLLNDLIRYWRTICVDFEGKRRGAGGSDPKYASRNAKLRTSRKVLFAGGLLPVLLCHTKTASEMPSFLSRQLTAPPTDRLAAAFMREDAVAEGARALRAYDRWIGLLGDASTRAELAALREADRESSPLFAQVREIGDELQRGLLTLLYETRLSPLTRWYGLF
jgi:hypothetical protein